MERGYETGDGVNQTNIAIVSIVLVLTLSIGWVTVVEVADRYESSIDECHEAGGDGTVHGELIYCEFDNGTGRPLGTEETPQPIEDQPASSAPVGLTPLLIVPGLVLAGVFAVGLVQRIRSKYP